MTRGVKPAGEGATDLDCVRLGCALGPYLDLDVVLGHVFPRRSGDPQGFATGSSAYIDGAVLGKPDPEGESAVQEGVDGYGGGGEVLGALKAIVIVPEKTCSCYGESRVAQRQADVGQLVRLLESEAVQVIGDGIVRGVFEVWRVSGTRP